MFDWYNGNPEPFNGEECIGGDANPIMHYDFDCDKFDGDPYSVLCLM